MTTGKLGYQALRAKIVALKERVKKLQSENNYLRKKQKRMQEANERIRNAMKIS